MLSDRYMDELVETFEDGFAATNSTATIVGPAVQADHVRITAWLDGACYSDPTIADSLVSYQRSRATVKTLH
jgi:hypothetical protein